MPFTDLIRIANKLYGPAVVLRSVFPPTTRHKVGQAFQITTLFLFVLALVTLAIKFSPIGTFPGISFIGAISGKIYGIFLIIFPCTFIFTALEAFHRSYYFRGLDQVIGESTDIDSTACSFEVATIVVVTKANDVTGTFLDSEYGQEIMYRAGITEDQYASFAKDRKPTLTTNSFILEKDYGVTLATYTTSIYKQDEAFRTFLAKCNINGDQLQRAAELVTSIERRERYRARWWSRDNLGRIPGLGKTWSYGETYLLERYGHDLVEDRVWTSALMKRRAEDDEVDELERILARARQSNALMVGDDTSAMRERVAQLYHKIREGHILPQLESKRIFLVDVETMVTAAKEKAVFEKTLIELMNQAVHAGNSIIYLERLTAAAASASTIGTDLVEVLLSYFDSDTIQIIATVDRNGFNTLSSRDTRITQAFDVVQMKDVGEDGLLDLLQQRATLREHETGVVFTVPALEAIGTLADRYFPSGVMPDKALDLLEELTPTALSQNIKQVQKTDVEQLVNEKTGIPVGTPSSEEREKLLSLEEYLHNRVVGQNPAVNAVAKALRRARAGVGNPNKPMGSFLFMGPTGVGKTETAKALAEALFGDEKAMVRLDMSEYTGASALKELIGSFETGKPGHLATLLREHQYGVLLLDEFEKSDREVHDLFLQILDEGRFTDAGGKYVNARNLIIIATSNAGADLIWDWEKKGQDIVAQKRILIDHIIGENLFRPEFLNRFDDIVVFHPLQKEQVRQIARLHLEKLAERIKHERNIELKITDTLVNDVAKAGYDPQFGGRPLERAIKERVEQMLADEILSDKLHAGDMIEYRT